MDASPDVVDVRLVGFPFDLYTRAREHYADLLREFSLLAVQPPSEDPGHDVPRRLVELVDRAGRAYAAVVLEPRRLREVATADRRGRLTVVCPVPRSFGRPCRELNDLLDEADEYCQEGELLTLAAGAEECRFRAWFLGEIIAQLDGEEPRAWGDYPV